MKKKMGIALLLLILILPVLPFLREKDVITARSWLVSHLGESGSAQVIAGKDGFLFFTESLERSLEPLSEEELNELKDGLGRLNTELKNAEKRFFVLIAPDKRTVYPDMLPTRWRVPYDEWDRVQRAVCEAGVETADVLPILLQEKEKGLVYFSGDTHWNARGALAVYRLLAEKLTLENAESYDGMRFLSGEAGDLIRLCRPASEKNEPDAAPDLQRTYRKVRPFADLDAMQLSTSSKVNSRNVLMIRDSFGKGLFPYLAENVGCLTFSRTYTSILSQADKAGADTVVLEIVERDLRNLIRYLKEGN